MGKSIQNGEESLKEYLNEYNKIKTLKTNNLCEMFVALTECTTELDHDQDVLKYQNKMIYIKNMLWLF